MFYEYESLIKLINLMSNNLKCTLFTIIYKYRRFNRTNKNFTIIIVLYINAVKNSLKSNFAILIIHNFKNR